MSSILQRIMCGILGYAGRKIDAKVFKSALDTLGQRGPDASDFTDCGPCTLGHTRLAIIDLSQGAQPMKDGSTGNTITFNGEIYNYRELRNKLASLGKVFKTDSDTEVILKAYAEFGTKCVQYLDGMFAFAIWDEKRGRFFLARDRFGKKPLYYAFDGSGNIIFSSEIKALEKLGVTPQIDPDGIDAFLTHMYVPPWRTFYKNIHTLPPAHTAVFDLAKKELVTEKYWQLSAESKNTNITYSEALEEVRRLFSESVKKRMIADVEVGAFLSGGVDSTLITAYATKESANPIKTFSMGYGDYINELPFAAEAATTLKTDHHALQTNSNLIQELESLSSYLDEPHADSANLAQHLLSQYTARSVKVALAGDGGDELFYGYGWYWAYWNRPKIITIKNWLTSNPYREHLKSVTVFPKSFRNALLQNNNSYDMMINTPHVYGDGMKQINAYDLSTYLPGQLLTKVDRTSMMHGLEIRCPLLDHALAEFVYQLPLEFNVDHSTGKFMLKDLLSEIMPRSFVDRKKQGFGAPVRKWLQKPEMRQYVLDTFSDNNNLLYHLLDRNVVQKHVTETMSSYKQKASYQVWVLLCLSMWLKKHPYV